MGSGSGEGEGEGEGYRRLRMSGSRNAVPARAKAAWPKRSEIDRLSSGTLVAVSHRRRGAALAISGPVAEAEAAPVADESVLRARRQPEAKAGTVGRSRSSGGGLSRACSVPGCARRRSIAASASALTFVCAEGC